MPRFTLYLLLFLTDMCVAIDFLNFGGPFKLFTSLKHRSYLVKQRLFKLRTIIHHPNLHRHVTYRAEDPSGLSDILLGEQQSITVEPTDTCEYALHVNVTKTKAAVDRIQ